jgi:hypothetical protein
MVGPNVCDIVVVLSRAPVPQAVLQVSPTDDLSRREAAFRIDM